MTTHTPGPWEDHGGEIHGGFRVVATVAWCSGLEDEDAANRRLIAVAPKLLAATRRALKAMDAYLDGQADDIEISHAIVDLNTAIAKAEGKS